MNTRPTPSSAAQELVLYTKSEAAEILRVKVSWLERQAAARQIPVSLLGGTYRFTPEHLAEIVRLNEQRGTTTTPAPSRSGKHGRGRRETSHQPPDGYVPLRPRPRRLAS